MKIRPTEVFTPGAFPTHTYIEREEERLENQLRDGLDTPGQVVALSGPSKSGKTVLVEKVVGRDLLITVPGAGVESPDDIWERALDWMDVPREASRSSSGTHGVGVEGKASGSSSLFGLAKGEVEGTGKYEYQREATDETKFGRRGLTQVVDEIGNSDFVLLIDDFHYMPRDVQVEAAKSLKEAVRLGIKICTAAVLHRGDDVVRANPELRGRVRGIDFSYWNPDHLRRIAIAGFSKLNVEIPERVIDKFVIEAAGSPQLMQLICLNACFVLNVREPRKNIESIAVNQDQCFQIFEQTSASTDFRSLVNVLDSGPKTRGTERKLYKFGDETDGDVYRCVLRAIASNPPQLSFDYEEIGQRTSEVCVGDSPVGSSIVGSCLHMSRLAIEKFPSERVIDWDEQKQILDIPDPYFLFYLRWSGRLAEQ